ncbi:MAG: rod shape-determining protein MreC [Candidatus Bruticola sp.]
MRQFKYWIKVLFLLIGVGFILEAVGGSRGMQTSVMSLSPLQSVISAVSGQADDWWRGFVQFASLSRSNDKLKSEVIALRAERSRLLSYRVQNLRLQSLLKLKEELPSDVKIAARVIARDPNNWDEKVILDCGRSDGVTEDMVAVSPEGLVGRVSQVASRSCTLTLIGSSSLAVPVAFVDSDICGIMRVNKMKRSIIKYVRFDIPVKSGQLVVTSGLGDIYPGGLAVGRVDRAYVSTDVMYQDVLVNLSAELPRLREVILIKKGKLSADPAIFKDAILRAEQEAKEAAKESAEAALREVNKYESSEPDSTASKVDKPTKYDSITKEVESRADSDISQEVQNEAASENAKNAAPVPAAEDIPAATVTKTQPSGDSDSVDENSEIVDKNESPELNRHGEAVGGNNFAAEEKTEETSEPVVEEQSAEGHYITVEEAENSGVESQPLETEAEESEPIPSTVELEP